MLIICVERLLHIGSHFSLRKWQRWPHFRIKLAAVASFSYKIGGDDKNLATLLEAVLTWSGYWFRLVKKKNSDFSDFFHDFSLNFFFYDLLLLAPGHPTSKTPDWADSRDSPLSYS